MKIEEAIKHLNQLKEEGSSHIVFEAWPAGYFGKDEKDPDWPDVAQSVMFDGDWSYMNQEMERLVEEAVARISAGEK